MVNYHKFTPLKVSLMLAFIIILPYQLNQTNKHSLACHLKSPHQRQISDTKNSTKAKEMLIKLALFLDTSLNHHLRYNLKLSEANINLLIVAYVDQIEAIFGGLRSESVSKIHINLVEMQTETYENQFTSNASIGGDIDRLLGEFCLYQAKERQRSETNWDLGLLLTAQDLYSAEEAKMSSMESSLSTMGISPVNGIGWPDLSCSIVELGVGHQDVNLRDSKYHRVYPTRGFASAWIAAHEVAHSLGLHHDGDPFNGECSLDKYIMSPTSYIGSMKHLWSKCSRDALDKLDLSKFTIFDEPVDTKGNSVAELPGQIFDSQFQCRMYSELLSSALATNSQTICNETLKCLDSNNELVTIGPALEGTICVADEGEGICIQNKCVKKVLIDLD